MIVIWDATGYSVVKYRVINWAASCSTGSAATWFTTSLSRGPSSYSEGRRPELGASPPVSSPVRWKSGDMAPRSLVDSNPDRGHSTQNSRRSWRD
jgi:hypothetical protein